MVHEKMEIEPEPFGDAYGIQAVERMKARVEQL